jgi:hypothetical protein
VLVRHVRVGEDDLVDVVALDQLLELGLGTDRDAVGVELPGQLRRVDAALDVRDLRRGERDHLELVTAAVDEVEVVEVAPGGSRDEHASLGHE